MTEAAPITAADETRTSPDQEADALDKRNRLVIRLLLVSAFVVILNETVMGVALPVLMEDLRITASAAQWLTTAFMLTMAVVIPITGFLLQQFHTRPVFIAAMSLFSAGTLIAAVSPGFEMLLVGRVVQASGTAIMMPLLFTTVMTLVPPAVRGRTMGNISTVISVAPAVGPALSGLILSVFEWRFIFIFVLPIALAALALGAAQVKNVTTPRPIRIDVFSVILSAFAFGGIVYGLSNLGGVTTGPVNGLLALVVGSVVLVLFVVRQLVLQRKERALLDLRTFASRTFSLSIGMMVISMMALFGTIILLPLYLQDVLGLGALESGLLVLPGGLAMGLLARYVGRLYDRIGPTLLLVVGSILVSAVLWTISFLTPTTPAWFVLVAHVIMCIGLALMFTPLFTASLGSIRPQLYSHGSAIVGTVQQVAGAAGIALFVTIMASQTAALVDDGASVVNATSAGIRAAFMTGAIISLFAIPAAFLIRKPAEVADGGHGH